MEIRGAVPADAHDLARLRYEFRASLGAVTEPEAVFARRCEAWMRERIEAANWHCWVALDGSIVGNLWLQLIEKLPNPVAELELHGYITNVYVRPEARRQGLAGRMVEAALDHCRRSGVDSVILWPTERSRPLYARHGFAVRDDLMEAILDTGRHLP